MVSSVLDPALRDEVLTRLGFSALPPANLEGLGELYEAWCRSVPFDNLRKWVHVSQQETGPLPGSDASEFFRAWLKHGTGGTCWSGNGALCSLLQSAGFDARRGVATMLVAPELPPNHGTVVVYFGDDEYLVDASILHQRPMLLRDDAMDCVYAHNTRLNKDNGKWSISWFPANRPQGLDCRIEYFPTDDADFQQRHEATRGWSPFNYHCVVRKVKGRCVAGVFGLESYQISGDEGVIQKREITRNERNEILIEQLGYSEEIVSMLPEDAPVPPPPGSATAARLQHT